MPINRLERFESLVERAKGRLNFASAVSFAVCRHDLGSQAGGEHIWLNSCFSADSDLTETPSCSCSAIFLQFPIF